MVKKLIFTAVLLLGLYLASVTAFAANTDAIAPQNVFAANPKAEQANAEDPLATSDIGPSPFMNTDTATPPATLKQEETASEEKTKAEIEMTDYIEKYADLFLDSKASPEDFIVSLRTANHNDLSANPLSYVLSGSIMPTETENTDNPVIILFFIKENGKYVPLNMTDIKDKKTNLMEKEAGLIFSNVNLLNLGSDKTNDIRIVAFRKNEIEKLKLNENLQITDLQVTVRKNNFEGVPFIFNIVMNSLDRTK